MLDAWRESESYVGRCSKYRCTCPHHFVVETPVTSSQIWEMRAVSCESCWEFLRISLEIPCGNFTREEVKFFTSRPILTLNEERDVERFYVTFCQKNGPYLRYVSYLCTYHTSASRPERIICQLFPLLKAASGSRGVGSFRNSENDWRLTHNFWR